MIVLIRGGYEAFWRRDLKTMKIEIESRRCGKYYRLSILSPSKLGCKSLEIMSNYRSLLFRNARSRLGK